MAQTEGIWFVVIVVVLAMYSVVRVVVVVAFDYTLFKSLSPSFSALAFDIGGSCWLLPSVDVAGGRNTAIDNNDHIRRPTIYTNFEKQNDNEK